MTELDDELRSWSDDWKRTREPRAIDPAAIEQEVRRRTLRLAIVAAVEFAILGVILAGLVAFSLSTRDPWDRAMVAAFSALIAVAFARGIAALRRTWRAQAETTRAFVELMVGRCETSLAQIRFGWVILLVEVAVFVPWIAHRTRAASASATAYAFLALVVAIAIVMLVVMRRRALRELARWRALRDEMQE